MRRMERRMYRRRRSRRAALCAVTALTLAVLGWRVHAARSLTARSVPQPTATPVARAFDETVQTREITLEPETWHAIQTGVFSTWEAAQEKAQAYAQRGAPGYVARDGGKYRVFLACYGETADASAVRERLRAVQQVETYQYAWQCPALRLRMSGMAGQLDVAQAGLTLRMQLAVRLRDEAILLDAGERTAAEITAQLAAMDDQAGLWLEVAQQRFARPYPALVESLCAFMSLWQEQRAALEKAGGDATALSAALKHGAMALYEDNMRFRAEWNARE